MIATIEGANTVDEIKEIVASLELAPEFIGNMQQLCNSMSKPELALFYHRCLGSLAITTLLKAIKNNHVQSKRNQMQEIKDARAEVEDMKSNQGDVCSQRRVLLCYFS